MPKYVLLWFPMIVIAIGNGIAREALYRGALGDLGAHQLSTAIMILLLAEYFVCVVRRWPFRYAREALMVGILWLSMTVAFEFLFGRFVMGHPWERLLNDYDLRGGRVWALILLWVALGPPLINRIIGSRQRDTSE
jgi:hypothetical protein